MSICQRFEFLNFILTEEGSLEPKVCIFTSSGDGKRLTLTMMLILLVG